MIVKSGANSEAETNKHQSDTSNDQEHITDFINDKKCLLHLITYENMMKRIHNNIAWEGKQNSLQQAYSSILKPNLRAFSKAPDI